MKKVVITGGAGFIGSHIAEELTKQGYYTIILDDLSTGKMENIEHLLNEKHTEFIWGTINDITMLQELFQDVYYVFHQAAIPSVTESIDNPLFFHAVNVTGTLNVLLAARDSKVKKVIYASSSAIYGDTLVLPHEECMLPNPQSPYAVTKLAGEYYCSVFQEVYGLPTVCLRYFNVYGPKQNIKSQYAAVIPWFISSVSKGSLPTIFGDGTQTRDFIFVKDVAEANIMAAEKDMSGIINIGRGESVSINDLAKLIIKISGKHMEPVYQKPRGGDIKHSLADISRARSFGYNPRYTLLEGLKVTVDRLRN